MAIESVGVIGGGAWGTALAQTLRLAGRHVVLWAREPETVEDINVRHVNRTFLPGISLDPDLTATSALADVAKSDAVLMVAPAQHVRTIAGQLRSFMRPSQPIILCAKGIEQTSGRMLGDVLAEILPEQTFAVLSGPSFAADVARGLPAALTIACAREEMGRQLAERLGYRQFRLYWSSDTIGVEIGGALKNVLAIAAGASDGLGFGHNARAALITRGLAETARLAVALGGRRETMMGLAGLGDLVLTCTGDLSRNRRVGLALAKGRKLADILAELGHVAEGVHAARAVRELAARHSIDMPIAEAVDRSLHEDLPVRQAVAELLRREPRPEAH